MKKLNFCMWAIMPFILIILFLFLPLFNTYFITNFSKDMTVFGYHFILGKVVKDSTNMINIVKISSSFNVMIVLIFLPITIFITNKFVKKDSAVKFINVLISVIMALYFYFFQFNNYKLLGDKYYNVLTFGTTIYYSLLAVIYALYAIYFIIVMIVYLKRKNKENKQYLTNNEIKENNDL